MDMLGKMASAIGETVITAKRYSELFNILLSAVTLGSLPQELDSVTVGVADRIRLPTVRWHLLSVPTAEFFRLTLQPRDF